MADEFTLADYEATAPPVTRAVVRTWREASPILDTLKFRTSNRLTEEVLRFNSIPTVPWRKVGEPFTQVKIEPEPVKERLHFLGAQIDVPYEYVKAESLVDNRATQSEAIIKGAAFAFNLAFFLNDDVGSIDVDAIVGIRHRILNDLGADQSLDAALDVSPDTAVATWQHKMFDVVEDLLSRVDGNPSDKYLFMGRTLHRRFQSACRTSNLLDTGQDQLGRQFITYGKGGPKLIDVGYRVDQTTPILGDAEINNTALVGGGESSMYCVRFGTPYIDGWCQEMPWAEDVGLLENRVNYRTVVRFSPGLYFSHPRAMALAWGWTAA
jgi:hypothetical protein